jgi:hypothetical protein
MSCASSWRLYPERSITSHRFCGSERLFPGLLESETRRAERMIVLMLWMIRTVLDARNIVPDGSDVKANLQTRTLHQAYMNRFAPSG